MKKTQDRHRTVSAEVSFKNDTKNNICGIALICSQFGKFYSWGIANQSKQERISQKKINFTYFLDIM